MTLWDLIASEKLTFHGIPQKDGGQFYCALGTLNIQLAMGRFSHMGNLQFFTLLRGTARSSLLGEMREFLPHWLKIYSHLLNQEKSPQKATSTKILFPHQTKVHSRNKLRFSSYNPIKTVFSCSQSPVSYLCTVCNTEHRSW